jgi:hypothetical protein
MKTAATVACILLGFAICSIAGNSIANNAEVNEYKVKAKTINVPLILKIWEIIFSFWATYFMGHF